MNTAATLKGMTRINPEEILNVNELTTIAGGHHNEFYDYDDEIVCPVHGTSHVYRETGESRPTSRWFYDTEEHYVCDCGKGYWRAGFFQWDFEWD